MMANFEEILYEDTNPVPSGMELSCRDNDLYIKVSLNLLYKILCFLIILAVTGAVGCMAYDPSLLGMKPVDVSWKWILPIWIGITLICLNFIIMKTYITVTPDTFKVVHFPWHFPLSIDVPTQDVRSACIDTIITTHRNKHGQEYETYSFKVQITQESSHRQPTIYSTSDEDQAVYLRNILQQYIEFMN